MKRIFLLRHGKPEFPAEEKYCLGVTDLPLSEAGRDEIRAAGEGLKDKGIRKIISSPLKRCRESAETLAALLGEDKTAPLPVEIREDLTEINMGSWDGLTFREIRARFPGEYEARGRDFARFRVPGGETFLELARRAGKAFQAICRENDGSVLLLGHAGWIKTVIAGREGKRIKEIRDISLKYGEVVEVKVPVFDALITAAGFSSRMGDFKPLMEISGKKNILRQIETLGNAGVRRICVVTGFRGEDIREAVREAGMEEKVIFAENPDYGTTEMFDSAKIGLLALLGEAGPGGEEAPDGVFLVPVDVPLFTEFSVRKLMEVYGEHPDEVLIPVWEVETPPGEPEEPPVCGHPVLVPKASLETVLAHDGTDGLQGAFDRCERRQVPMADPGGMMDADTKEAFQLLVLIDLCRGVPGKADCLKLLEYFRVPEETISHMEKVAAIALALGRRAQAAGAEIDLRLLYAAAMLHDIAKGQENHAEAGARLLSQLEMREAADLVRTHMDLPEEYLQKVNEHMLLYLADKMCRGTVEVTPEERFEAKKEKLAGDEEALAAWKKRYDAALKARDLLTKLEDNHEED